VKKAGEKTSFENRYKKYFPRLNDRVAFSHICLSNISCTPRNYGMSGMCGVQEVQNGDRKFWKALHSMWTVVLHGDSLLRWVREGA